MTRRGEDDSSYRRHVPAFESEFHQRIRRYELWDKVQVCLGTRTTPATNCLRTTSDYVVLNGMPQNNHNFLLLPTGANMADQALRSPLAWSATAGSMS